MASLKANIAQESAVNSIYGPVIIVSCPGSGKTTTLVRRINRMIEAGIDARSILMVTFTKSAAADMEKRYRQIYGEAPGVVFQTIHALCRNILVAERVIGEKSLLNEKESREILSGLLEGRPEIGNAIDMAETMLSEFGKYKESDISLEDYEPSGCEKSLFMEIADAYTSAKKEIGKVDFDDLLTGCRDLLRDNRKTLSKWQRRFQFIQCDEYQDTSRIQKDILYMLAGKKANLCVVGDDDQSIYRFRGADNHIMMQFEEDFGDRGVRKILMNTNYRSAPEIVDMADVCIRNNRVRFAKEFISERGREGAKGTAEYKAYRTKAAELEDIISVIRQRSKEKVPYSEMAILFRTNRQASLPVQALSAEDIPYYSTENVTTVYDDWMFTDIRAYIELSMGINTRQNLFRVLNRPNRYLPAAQFRDIDFDIGPMTDAIKFKKGDERAWAYKSAKESIDAWFRVFGPGMITEDTPTADMVKKLEGRGTIQYDAYLRQVAKQRRKEEDDLLSEFEELKQDALRFATVGEWLAHARMVSEKVRRENADKRKKNKDGVTVTTMHKAKGREWKVVFILGANDNVIPGRQAITKEDLEEERRILYVAMTRAKDELYIGSTAEPSRFIVQTIEGLREKYKPTIKKKLAGAPVMHKDYGKGKVVGYTQDRIAVMFDGTVRKFVFPDAFKQGQLEYL